MSLLHPFRFQSPLRLRRERTGAFGKQKSTTGNFLHGAVRKGRSSSINSIGKHWLGKPDVVKRGEREICNPATVGGCAEYKWRVMLMWLRQDGWCCFHEYDFCPGRLHLNEATFQHEALRGKDRDDRIWLPETRKHANGAAHGICNGIAGSVRMPIDHGTNHVTDVRDL